MPEDAQNSNTALLPAFAATPAPPPSPSSHPGPHLQSIAALRFLCLHLSPLLSPDTHPYTPSAGEFGAVIGLAELQIAGSAGQSPLH